MIPAYSDGGETGDGRYKVKKSQISRIQGFSDYFPLMIKESGTVTLIQISMFRIRNTESKSGSDCGDSCLQ